MFEQISSQDKRNSFWLSMFFIACTILVVLFAFWFYGVVNNDVIESTKSEQQDDSDTPSIIDDDKTVVQVANATRTTGLAGEFSRNLQALDYITLNPINIDSQSTSQVYFQTDPVSRQTEAKAIALRFRISEDDVSPFPDDLEIEELNKETEVLVIIGRNIKL